MSGTAGSLSITAGRRGPRTILERIRYDGISRCSRAFASGEAALVVMSQLGPGVVRGDSVTTRGRVNAGAHLIVTNQAATRLMGGARESLSQASWTLDEGAVLELLGEPLVAHANARYSAATTIELGPRAFVLITELARVPAGANVRSRTLVRRGTRELVYDAFEAAAVAPHTVGTLIVTGLADNRIVPIAAALDRAADTIEDAMAGVGVMSSGVLVRVLATDTWHARSILASLRETVWTALRSGGDAQACEPPLGAAVS